MKLAVLTLTDGNPITSPLIARWVQHQTRRPDLWVVSNDANTRNGPRTTIGCAVNMVRGLRRNATGKGWYEHRCWNNGGGLKMLESWIGDDVEAYQ